MNIDVETSNPLTPNGGFQEGQMTAYSLFYYGFDSDSNRIDSLAFFYCIQVIGGFKWGVFETFGGLVCCYLYRFEGDGVLPLPFRFLDPVPDVCGH
jgi:hypothetical protein